MIPANQGWGMLLTREWVCVDVCEVNAFLTFQHFPKRHSIPTTAQSSPLLGSSWTSDCALQLSTALFILFFFFNSTHTMTKQWLLSESNRQHKDSTFMSGLNWSFQTGITNTSDLALQIGQAFILILVEELIWLKCNLHVFLKIAFCFGYFLPLSGKLNPERKCCVIASNLLSCRALSVLIILHSLMWKHSLNWLNAWHICLKNNNLFSSKWLTTDQLIESSDRKSLWTQMNEIKLQQEIKNAHTINTLGSDTDIMLLCITWQPGQLDQHGMTSDPPRPRAPGLEARERRFTERQRCHRNSVCISQWAIPGALEFRHSIQCTVLSRKAIVWGNSLKAV